MDHRQRSFVNRVDFVTGAGYLDSAHAREHAGLGASGPRFVVTELAVLGFNAATKRMQLESLHPGVSVGLVQERTGFPIRFPIRFRSPRLRRTRNSPPYATALTRMGVCCQVRHRHCHARQMKQATSVHKPLNRAMSTVVIGIEAVGSPLAHTLLMHFQGRLVIPFL